MHGFDAAVRALKLRGSAVKRKDWRTFLTIRDGEDLIKMVWPSGAEHEWIPWPQDLVAEDWVLMVTGGVLKE